MTTQATEPDGGLSTEVLDVDRALLHFQPPITSPSFPSNSTLTVAPSTTQHNINNAAQDILTTNTPVAFPTETVYGLGADATRPAAVRNIFVAKQRPADNPLIVHVHSLEQLRQLLRPRSPNANASAAINGHEKLNGFNNDSETDPIPAIYKPLTSRFWPGPLTIILPNPPRSQLAPEVTAGLPTFGARMPAHPVALALLKASDVPLAAPSANASTKPSPTTAQHVYHDLKGRISTILDGGPCGVGVESTVVDGLSTPPCVLRPGGVSVTQLKECEGWEDVVVGYQDKATGKGDKPKAPGMKYKHYSPRASVILFESGSGMPQFSDLQERATGGAGVGVIRTLTWPQDLGLQYVENGKIPMNGNSRKGVEIDGKPPLEIETHRRVVSDPSQKKAVIIHDVSIGREADEIAQGLFAALRLLDLEGVTAIFIEGIDGGAGGVAAAVMNRLRKAAEVKV